jgi:hypothetical protein
MKTIRSKDKGNGRDKDKKIRAAIKASRRQGYVTKDNSTRYREGPKLN